MPGASSASADRDQLYLTLLDSIRAIFWEADAETFQFHFVSPQAESMLGYPVEDWTSQPDFWVRHTHPEDVDRCAQYCQAATAEGRDHDFEYRMLAADGREVWLHDVVTVVRHEDGVVRLRGVMTDVTDRKRAELAARESEFRYQIVAHATSDAVWDWNLETETVWWNEGMSHLFGYDPESIGRDLGWWVDRIHDDDRSAVVDALFTAIRGRDSDWRSEYRFARADGSFAYVLNRGRILRREDGTAKRMAGALIDLTDRKIAEEAHLESERRLQSILDNSPTTIYVKDLEGRYVLVNRQHERLLGRPREEIYGRTDAELFAPPVAAAFRANDLKVIEAAAPLEFEETYGAPDGMHAFISVKFPLLDASGRITELSGISTDLTAMKQLEAQLRQSQKLEAIGRLSGGIAHDFNNLLTVIGGYSDLLRKKLGGEHPLHWLVDEIKGSGDRAAALTRQLLAFSRQQMLQPRILDLNLTVAEMERMLRRLIGEDVELETRLDPAVGRVSADPSQIEQVVMNLAVNARDAMPDGGRLTIETSNEELDEAAAARIGCSNPGPYVRLTIRDTGRGIEPSLLPHLFEPFFTTKAEGKGTGLGLSTVYGIVAQSGGCVRVESEPGRGATFEVLLPRVEGLAPAMVEGRGSPEEPLEGRETILLVEDEEGVRRFARVVLERCGYTVVEADSGEAALRLLDELSEPVHLLLTDVVMPRMSGRDLAREVTRRRPEARVLYMSGYTDSVIRRDDLVEPGRAFLEKPFGPTGLASAVRTLLDAPGESDL